MSITEKMLEINRNNAWWILLFEGLVAIIVGIIFFVAPVVASFGMIKILGIYLVARGVIAIGSLFFHRGDDWVSKLIMGIVAILLGIFTLTATEAILNIYEVTLGLLIGFGAVVIGFIDLIKAIRGGGCWYAILGAIISLLGLIWIGQFWLSRDLIPYILGGVLIVGGIAAIITSFRVRALSENGEV